MAKSVTVVIPTRNRPELLKETLASVAEQTARSEIKTVLISDNSETPTAKEVAAEFPTLPIEITVRNPVLSLTAHQAVLLSEANTEFTALLHDDDWWFPGHLATALDALANSPTCAGFAAASIYVESPESNLRSALYLHRLISEVGGSNYQKNGQLDFGSLAQLCWLYTPFHLSTIVARSGPLKDCCEAGMADWDILHADRRLYPLLGLHGGVTFSRYPTAFIRHHAGQNLAEFRGEEEIASALQTGALGSQAIANLASEQGFDLSSRWKDLLASSPPEIHELVDGLGRPHLTAEMREAIGLNPPRLVHPWVGEWDQMAKYEQHLAEETEKRRRLDSERKEYRERWKQADRERKQLTKFRNRVLQHWKVDEAPPLLRTSLSFARFLRKIFGGRPRSQGESD